MRTHINVCLLSPQHPLQLAVILFPPVLATVGDFDLVMIQNILPSYSGPFDFVMIQNILPSCVAAFDFVMIQNILLSCVGAFDFEKLISSLTCLGLRDKSGQPLSLSSSTPSSPAIVDQATSQLMRLTFSSAAAMACLSGWNSLACK